MPGISSCFYLSSFDDQTEEVERKEQCELRKVRTGSLWWNAGIKAQTYERNHQQIQLPLPQLFNHCFRRSTETQRHGYCFFFRVRYNRIAAATTKRQRRTDFEHLFCGEIEKPARREKSIAGKTRTVSERFFSSGEQMGNGEHIS